MSVETPNPDTIQRMAGAARRAATALGRPDIARMLRRTIISAEVKHEVLARSDHRCAMCGRPSDLKFAHVVPMSEGGESSASNLVALCRSCHYTLDINPTMSVAELKPQRSQVYEFERIVSDYLQRIGFAVLEGATGPDGGVDLVARRADPLGSMFVLIECKTSG